MVTESKPSIEQTKTKAEMIRELRDNLKAERTARDKTLQNFREQNIDTTAIEAAYKTADQLTVQALRQEVEKDFGKDNIWRQMDKKASDLRKENTLEHTVLGNIEAETGDNETDPQQSNESSHAEAEEVDTTQVISESTNQVPEEEIKPEELQPSEADNAEVGKQEISEPIEAQEISYTDVEDRRQQQTDRKLNALYELVAKLNKREIFTVDADRQIGLLQKKNIRNASRAEAENWLDNTLDSLKQEEQRQEMIKNIREYRSKPRTTLNEILDVSPDASKDQVKKSFRLLSNRFHPDTYNLISDKGQAEEIFKSISNAYDELIDILDGKKSQQNADAQGSSGSSQRTENEAYSNPGNRANQSRRDAGDSRSSDPNWENARESSRRQYTEDEKERVYTNLDNATTISDILFHLQKLVDMGVVIDAKVGTVSVLRYPGEIISRIKNAQQKVLAGKTDEVESIVRNITSLFDLRSKVKKELAVTDGLIKDLKKPDISIQDIAIKLTDLAKLGVSFPVFSSKEERGYRNPRDILVSIQEMVAHSNDSARVHQQMDNVTSLFDLRYKVYHQIRNTWNPVQQWWNPVPEMYKKPYQQFVTNLNSRG